MSIKRETISSLRSAERNDCERWHPLPGEAICARFISGPFGMIISAIDEHEVLVIWSLPLTDRQRAEAELAESMSNQIQDEEDTQILNILRDVYK